MKTNVDDLEVDKSKTVPIDLKKLNDVVSKEIVKNKKNQLTKHVSYWYRKRNS